MSDLPIASIKGIGPRRGEALGKLGLFSLQDLLYHLPRDYRDYSRATPVTALEQGQDAAVEVTLLTDPRSASVRKGLSLVTVTGQDDTGKVQLVWYNQPYRRNAVTAGERVVACGRVDKKRGSKLINPTLFSKLPGILPVYPLSAGITQKVLRDAVRVTLAAGLLPEDPLPRSIIAEHGLCSLQEALQNLHFPGNFSLLREAKRRLAFQDTLLYTVMLRILRTGRGQSGIAFHTDGLLEAFLPQFPFPPTEAQKRAMREIAADMEQSLPMNRLLQGDVGSGKTLPALFAMFIAVQNGYQAALMAPTEILAEQHFVLLQKLFGDKAGLVTGSMKAAERRQMLEKLQSGELLAVTGTHALIGEKVSFAKLGLVIADEQHRFGVRQRAALAASGNPDVLIMSATPIPRTLSLILYGDLDLSVLNELPPGRQKVITRIVPPEKREDMYRYLEKRAAEGKQAYVVCPLVENSEEVEALSASEVYRELSSLLSSNVGLLHGAMSGKKKEEAISAFRSGEISILVSTTVIEVGVDVPNATVMVIEDADRFGLATLHQLRGRVGRGSEQSYCFLLSESGSETAHERLRVLTETNDGFAIAEADLTRRGPGELLGQAQHGLTGFAAAALALDLAALQEAREAAERLLLKPPTEDTLRIERAAAERLSRLTGIAPN